MVLMSFPNQFYYLLSSSNLRESFGEMEDGRLSNQPALASNFLSLLRLALTPQFPHL